MPSWRNPEEIPHSKPGYYNFYLDTIKIYAQIMSAINAYKRGNDQLFDAYMNKLASAIENYSSSMSYSTTEL